MSKTPVPVSQRTFLRAGIIGAGLGFLGVGVFIGLWILLDQAGIADFPRLITALCIPPALIALIIGLYMLIVQPDSRRKK